MPATKLTRDSPIEDRSPEILRRLTAAYPEATVALAASNPLEILVATILSAQCTDERVNQVTRTLFQKYRAPEDYVRVPEAELAEDIRPTGYFNQKTRSIRGACVRIIEEFDGEVPDSMAELVTLPGVGRKTANVVLRNGFGRVEGIAVDTHVKRLSRRLGYSAQSDPEKIERDLMRILARDDWSDITYKLIDHGRAICHSRRPRCADCVLSDLCPSSEV